MHTITKIERQKKRSSRWSVFIDGKFAFGCSDELLASFGIREGDTISEEKLNQIGESVNVTSIRQKALGYLSRRSRSVSEMRKYLEEKGFEKGEIAGALQWLKERGYLNDERFADEWVKTRLGTAPRGRQRLLLELFQKGIDRTTATKAIEDNLAPASEADVAYETILRRKSRWHDMEWLEIERKIHNFLSYRGFSGDAIIEACRRFREDHSRPGSEVGEER